jgi:hypothetical protein
VPTKRPPPASALTLMKLRRSTTGDVESGFIAGLLSRACCLWRVRRRV